MATQMRRLQQADTPAPAPGPGKLSSVAAAPAFQLYVINVVRLFRITSAVASHCKQGISNVVLADGSSYGYDSSMAMQMRRLQQADTPAPAPGPGGFPGSF
jgi:hypothetical protein